MSEVIGESTFDGDNGDDGFHGVSVGVDRCN